MSSVCHKYATNLLSEKFDEQISKKHTVRFLILKLNSTKQTAGIEPAPTDYESTS